MAALEVASSPPLGYLMPTGDCWPEEHYILPKPILDISIVCCFKKMYSPVCCDAGLFLLGNPLTALLCSGSRWA